MSYQQIANGFLIEALQHCVLDGAPDPQTSLPQLGFSPSSSTWRLELAQISMDVLKAHLV